MKPELPNRIPDPSEEMLLTAFQYVTGELDDRAKDEFEGQLRDDPVAQQALIEAVRISEAAYASFQAPVQLKDSRSESSGYSRSWIAIVASAAIVLLGFGSWWIYQANFQKDVPSTADATVDHEQVANVWVTAMDQVNGTDEGFEFFDDSQSEEESWLVDAYMEGGGSFSVFKTENSMFNE